MIQKGSFLEVSDNSGATLVMCIHVYKKKYGLPGDIILVSVKQIRNKRKNTIKIKKGSLSKAIIIRSRSKTFLNKKYNNAFEYKSFDNSVVLINKNNKPIGTRVLGSVDQSIRYSRYSKIATMSTGFLS